MSDIAGTWTSERIAGHPADVYEPPERNEHGFVAIYLHGVHLGRLVDKPDWCRQFDRHGLPVVAPMTQRSWWTDKICPEFDPEVSAERHLLDNVLPFVEQRFAAQPPRIALVGTSMGGQGALRMAFKYPQTFPIAAAVAPAIDYQQVFDDYETLPAMYRDEEQARQDTALLHVHPLNWARHVWFCCDPEDERWFDSSDRLRMKLASLGIPHHCDLETSAGGHGWTYYNRMAEAAVGFIASRLENDRLQLPLA